MKTLVFISVIVVALIFSCTKPKVYPIVPEISFKEMILLDTINPALPENQIKLIVLTMSVVDGDGDIGLLEDVIWPGFDTLDNKNLFISLC